MKTVTLYVLTALVTGLHNFYRIMNMLNGAPVPLLNCAALLGSVTLLGAAVLLLFQPRVAAKVGLTGSLLSWVFYAPLLIVSVMMPFSAWIDIQSYLSFHEYIPLVGMLLGPILLIATTVNSTLLVRRHRIPAT
jgi:hypothetical protein